MKYNRKVVFMMDISDKMQAIDSRIALLRLK